MSKILDRLTSMSYYRLTDKGKEITWEAWHTLGGCMPSWMNQTMAGRNVGLSVMQWDALTLGELTHTLPSFEREIARFAFINFPALGLAEEYNPFKENL